MKTLKKITLLAALIASVSAANATTKTATMTINAFNDSVCSVAFSANTVTFGLTRDAASGHYILGGIVGGTTTYSTGSLAGGAAPTLATASSVGNLIYACTAGAVAAITITTANNFTLVNQDDPSSKMPYAMFLATPTGEADTAAWVLDNNITTATTNIGSSVLAGKSVIRTGGGALTGANTTSAITIAAGTEDSAVSPGHYQDIVTATMVY